MILAMIPWSCSPSGHQKELTRLGAIQTSSNNLWNAFLTMCLTFDDVMAVPIAPAMEPNRLDDLDDAAATVGGRSASSLSEVSEEVDEELLVL